MAGSPLATMVWWVKSGPSLLRPSTVPRNFETSSLRTPLLRFCASGGGLAGELRGVACHLGTQLVLNHRHDAGGRGRAGLDSPLHDLGAFLRLLEGAAKLALQPLDLGRRGVGGSIRFRGGRQGPCQSGRHRHRQRGGQNAECHGALSPVPGDCPDSRADESPYKQACSPRKWTSPRQPSFYLAGAAAAIWPSAGLLAVA